MNGRSIENMTPEDLLKLLYQCGGDTLMLDVWRQNSPLNSAGSSPIPSGTCALPNIPDNLVSSPLKTDSRRNIWESVSNSSKGSMKNIKTSGSQTDSLDSPGLPRRHKDRKNSDKDLDHKGRHSVHLFDKAMLKVDKMFRQRHKSQEREREQEEKIMLSVRPRTMIETDEDVLGEFDFPAHPREISRDIPSSSNRPTINVPSSHNSDLDTDISGTGTWPKCVRVTNPANMGTIVLPQHQKNHQKRPTLDAVINPIPVQKVPPLPPERNESSFVAVRHTPQNSDSTITYNSHPPSPIHSPQPSNSSQYTPKSPINRRPLVQESNFTMYSHNYSQPQNGTHSARVNNTKNPPRMPPIPSTVTTPFQLEPKLTDRQIPKNRPVSSYNNREHRTTSHGGYIPSSQTTPSVDYNTPGCDLRQFGSRSNNPTPEPFSSPPHSTPSQFTSIPPGGKHYPKPNMVNSRYDYNLLYANGLFLLV